MTWKPSLRKTIIDGAVYHQADWFEGGKRHRKSFCQRPDLDAFIKTKRDELRSVEELRGVEGKNHAVVRLSHLAPDERSAVADALATITKAGGTCLPTSKTRPPSHPGWVIPLASCTPITRTCAPRRRPPNSGASPRLILA